MEPNFGSAFSGTYAIHPGTRRIAAAGLGHWNAYAESCSDEFLSMVALSVNSGEAERTFVRRGFHAVNDQRWLALLYRTVALSIYEESRRLYGQDSDTGLFMMIDSFGCQRRGHPDVDGLHALASDEVWQTVRAPFAWLCGCSTYYVLPEDLMPSQRKLRPTAQIVKHCSSWLSTPPDRFLNFVF